MQHLGRLAVFASVATFLLFRSPIADAYIISIVGDPWVSGGENFSLTTTADRISLSDFFDQYDETRWEIASAEEEADGRVRVSYNYPVYGTWDSYGSYVNLQFQILSESGDLTPEPVTVDIRGSTFYRWQNHHACCFSDAPQVNLLGTSDVPAFLAANDSYNFFDASYSLLSNTTYQLGYFNAQYVEGSPLDSYLPTYFSSWDQYNSFVANTGTSGTLWVSAFGFMDYNVALRPTTVPEPATLTLFALGLVGLGCARRRRSSSTHAAPASRA